MKVFNLLTELYRLVAAKGKEQPHLIPIGERAEAIRQAFEERQISSQQALAQLEALIRQLQNAEAERQESNLSPEAFAVSWWLRVQKGMSSEQAEQLAAEVDPAFHEFPHWGAIPAQERELRKHLYKALQKADSQRFVSWADEILTLLRKVAG